MPPVIDIRRLALAKCLPVACALVLAAMHKADAGSSPAQPAQLSSSARETAALGSNEIEALIRRLGSDAYAERRRAEERLIRLGAAAYDQLKRYEDDADVEIANRVSYILHQIDVAWVRPNDPVQVKKLLAPYPNLSDEDRSRVIRQLGRLDGEIGFAPLCRIARFESSPRLARRAALAAMSVWFSADGAERVADVQQAELGQSDRTPVKWIRLYSAALETPQDAASQWSRAVADEVARLQSGANETDVVVVVDLIERYLQLCRRLQLIDEMDAALQQLIQLSELDGWIRDGLIYYLRSKSASENDRAQAESVILASAPDATSDAAHSTFEAANNVALRYASEWILDNETWQVHERFEQKFGEVLRQQRPLLYLLAAAYSLGGEVELGRQTAEQAFALPDLPTERAESDPPADGEADSEVEEDDEQAARRRELEVRRALYERVASADAVADRGFIDWAQREYRYVVSYQRPPDFVTLSAATDLGMWLHDRGQHKSASDAIGQVCDRLEKQPAAKRRLNLQLDQRLGGGEGAAYLKQIDGYRAYYLACHFEQQNEYQQQRQQLAAAAALYPLNPDVLIAMYRSPGADEQFRQQTLQLIRKTTNFHASLIDESPSDPRYYNQWAWLVANTVGDYQKAVQYSHKSLELSPGEPSYLDTLGRCYYAVGDLENAVKYQRQAVQLQPHMQVMQRQLELFESELASRDAGDEPPADADSDAES